VQNCLYSVQVQRVGCIAWSKAEQRCRDSKAEQRRQDSKVESVDMDLLPGLTERYVHLGSDDGEI
jgi:hypothetical protein